MPWLRVITSIIVACTFAGCGVLAAKKSEPEVAPTRAESLDRMDPARIQADTMGFADRFVTAMSGIYDELEKRADSPVAKAAAQQLKTDLTIGAISNAVNPRPVAGLVDMVVLVTLLRQISEDPWAQQTFGDDAAYLVKSLQRQEADIRTLARRYLTDEHLTELATLAEKWYQTHPDDRSVSHVHLADLPEANRPPQAGPEMPSSVFGLLFFDPTSNLDPAVREIEMSRATSERMFFYLQRLPMLLQLQTESFYRQVLRAPEIRQVLEDTSAVARSTTQFAETGSRFTAILGQFPEQLSREREAAIAQLAAEVAKQRDAAIRQLADATIAERDAAIRQLADAVLKERDAAIVQATTQITRQSDQTIADMSGLMRQERQALVIDLEAATARSINRLLIGLAIVGVIVVVLSVIAALVFRGLVNRSAHP